MRCSIAQSEVSTNTASTRHSPGTARWTRNHSDIRMNVKQWAFFFVFLLSGEYMLTMAVAVARHKRSYPPQQCRPSRRLVEVFDQCLERVRTQVEDPVTLEDTSTDGVQLRGGTATNIRNFRRVKPVTCQCLSDRIRIFLEISFLDVTVTFLVTLLDGVLGGLLGNLGSQLARLLGNVVNLVVNLVALEITLTIAVDQRFLPGSRCRVTSYRVTRISEIKVLGLDLTPLVTGLLGDLLTPVFDALVRNLLERQLRVIITREIQKITLTDDMHNCRQPQPGIVY
ncbi:hypothetical protein JTE90_021238 [Oedothorax gibbosus]|uniref:Uncharacterized protein n=1 Tax=Oedothorax gibbosus TaxID=931172 RepID=A0AAV6UV51_9ARAC|nr:hypothetical protein JTE90_021238 [Oedothorax gibbosus]